MEKEILKKEVLVLNKCWSPINVITIVDAINDVLNNNAKIVDKNYRSYDLEEWIVNWSDLNKLSEYDKDMLIRTGRCTFPAPEVIILRKYSGKHIPKVKLNRRNIYIRDNYTCQYCGSKKKSHELNLDHVIPKSKGGITSWKNLVTSCIECNTKKRNRTPSEAKMSLLKSPSKPKFFSSSCYQIPKTWEEFVGQLYWDIKLEEP